MMKSNMVLYTRCLSHIYFVVFVYSEKKCVVVWNFGCVLNEMNIKLPGYIVFIDSVDMCNNLIKCRYHCSIKLLKP